MLIKCLEDEDPRVRDIAALSLGRIALAPEMVVPALTNCLQHPTVMLKARAIWALGVFKENAAQALPTVIASLNDPDEGGRKVATNALSKIAPQLVTPRLAQ